VSLARHYSCVVFQPAKVLKESTGRGRPSKGFGAYRIKVKTPAGTFSCSGFQSRELAARYADIARKFLVHHVVMSDKNVRWNFPEEVNAINFTRDVGVSLRHFAQKAIIELSHGISPPELHNLLDQKMKYRNVIFENTTPMRFSYRIMTMAGSLTVKGFETSEGAAWAADKARFTLKAYIRRGRDFNFPERIEAASESELCNLSEPLATMLAVCRAAFPEALTEDKNCREELIKAEKGMLDIDAALLAMHCYRDIGYGNVPTVGIIIRRLEKLRATHCTVLNELGKRVENLPSSGESVDFIEEVQSEN